MKNIIDKDIKTVDNVTRRFNESIDVFYFKELKNQQLSLSCLTILHL